MLTAKVPAWRASQTSHISAAFSIPYRCCWCISPGLSLSIEPQILTRPDVCPTLSDATSLAIRHSNMESAHEPIVYRAPNKRRSTIELPWLVQRKDFMRTPYCGQIKDRRYARSFLESVVLRE